MKRTPLKSYKRLQSHTALKRGQGLRKVSAKRKSRVGKLGIVRKVGKDMTELREHAFRVSGGECLMRDDNGNRYPMCWGWASFEQGELAHIRTKRNNGDTPDNVLWACPNCHERSHNCGGKPCPKKPQREAVQP